eukprot:83910-Chlamydomonas_euryale.AAC.5
MQQLKGNEPRKVWVAGNEPRQAGGWGWACEGKIATYERRVDLQVADSGTGQYQHHASRGAPGGKADDPKAVSPRQRRLCCPTPQALSSFP